MLPYIVVLLTALAGVHVMLVLTLGLFASAVIGVFTGGYDIFGCLSAMGEGITGMGELIIVTLLAGGMLELIRFNGGMDYIIARLTAHVSSKRWAELSIAALVSLANLCTANNTIAIITTGSIARDITRRFGLDARKTASILDTFSCAVQGLIPYGAQLLIAAGLTQLVAVVDYPLPLLPGFVGTVCPAGHLAALSPPLFPLSRVRLSFMTCGATDRTELPPLRRTNSGPLAWW